MIEPTVGAKLSPFIVVLKNGLSYKGFLSKGSKDFLVS